MALVGYQIAVNTGYAGGQSLINTSVAGITVNGRSTIVQVNLYQTNYPGATFQAIYKLDGGGPIFTGVMFTADAQGNATTSFTITNIASGNHTLTVEVNNTPAPGNTLYLTPTPIPFTVSASTQATQQMQIYTGKVSGQTLNSAASSVSVSTSGATATVQVTLAGTAPNATFQPVYSLGGPPVFTGVMFTSDAQGNATATFTINGLASGTHNLSVEINNTPAPGDTIYNNPTPVTFTVSASAQPTQQMQIYTGKVSGQTLNSAASSASVSTSGATATVQVTLAGTAPNATFQPAYSLDGGAPVFTGVMFTSDAQGNATTTFTINGLASGNHTLSVEINNTPAPGDTIYNNPTLITFTV